MGHMEYRREEDGCCGVWNPRKDVMVLLRDVLADCLVGGIFLLAILPKHDTASILLDSSAILCSETLNVRLAVYAVWIGQDTWRPNFPSQPLY